MDRISFCAANNKYVAMIIILLLSNIFMLFFSGNTTQQIENLIESVAQKSEEVKVYQISQTGLIVGIIILAIITLGLIVTLILVIRFHGLIWTGRY